MSDAVHVVCSRCDSVNRMAAEKLYLDGKCGRCHERLFDGQVPDLDQGRFDRHIAHSDIPLVVDFWAPWCGPCQAMAPAYQQAAAELEPRVRLVKVNTEAQPSLATRYAVRSIPTLIVFRNGRGHSRMAGALDRRSLVDWIKKQL